MASDGRLAPADLIWCEGKTASWVPARSAKGLFPQQAGPPPLLSQDAGPPPLPAAESAPGRTKARGRLQRNRARNDTKGDKKPSGKKGLKAFPVWAKVLIGAAIGTTVLLIRIDCDSGGGGGSAPPTSTWQPGGGGGGHQPSNQQRPVCRGCGGTGRSRTVLCYGCGGTGISTRTGGGGWGAAARNAPCGSCRGQRFAQCSNCGGSGSSSRVPFVRIIPNTPRR